MTPNYSTQQVFFERSDFSPSTGNSITYASMKYAHEQAMRDYPGMEVVYPTFNSNNEINVIVSSYGGPIQLGNKTDFNYQTLNIIRNSSLQSNIYLFQMVNTEVHQLLSKVSKKDVDSGQFSHIDELKCGMKLLFVHDNHFWTYHNEQGNKYRRDILLLKDGNAVNSVIAPYDTNGTYLTTSYCDTDDSVKSIKNLTVIRPINISGQNVTRVAKILCQNNLSIENVTVKFDNESYNVPEAGDYTFWVENCTNVSFSNVTIQGTYSTLDLHGYGFYLDTIWNSRFEHVTAYGLWGVFGTYNLNKVYLKCCHLNRIDLHCYGADITCETCVFSAYSLVPPDRSTTHYYNRFDGLYGVLYYRDCIFDDFCPIRIDSAFKLFTGFDCIMDNCTINIGPNVNYLVSFKKLGNSETSPRPECGKISWPNLIINNLNLNLNLSENSVQSSLTPYSLFYIYFEDLFTYAEAIDYITLIQINTPTIGEGIYIKEFHTDVDAVWPINRVIDSCLTVINRSQPVSALSYVKSIYH